VIQGWRRVLNQFYPVGEKKEEDLEITKFLLGQSSKSRGSALAGILPNDVPHQQEEGVPGRSAEVGAVDGSYHDICVSVQELDEFFQAPEAALQTAQEELGKLIIRSTFQPVVQVFQSDPDDLDDGEEQGPEGERAGVVPRAAEGREEGEGGHVVGLLEGPVVRREGPRQRDLAQRDHEVGQPEEHEDVVELEDDEVLVVGRLAPVEREEALGVRARLGDIARVERLEGRRKRTQGAAAARATEEGGRAGLFGQSKASP
uniref:Uncharacterized protein n=1 Tax=Apteryx owenii TaxID=8824 RepID=A0A8B9QLI5_APTOW